MIGGAQNHNFMRLSMLWMTCVCKTTHAFLFFKGDHIEHGCINTRPFMSFPHCFLPLQVLLQIASVPLNLGEINGDNQGLLKQGAVKSESTVILVYMHFEPKCII